jgi:hypothetical protein
LHSSSNILIKSKIIILLDCVLDRDFTIKTFSNFCFEKIFIVISSSLQARMCEWKTLFDLNVFRLTSHFLQISKELMFGLYKNWSFWSSRSFSSVESMSSKISFWDWFEISWFSFFSSTYVFVNYSRLS